MIRFEIYDMDADKTDRVFRCPDGRFGDMIYMDMYEYLMRRFCLEHDAADDAVSWCDIASVGSVYYGDGFEIYVEEE